MEKKPFHRPGQISVSPWHGFIHDSTEDWCEGNYLESIYIAETWNAWSNIPFIALALFGVWNTNGLPHRTRYALTYLGVAAIGVGSFIFHSTLSWHAQVLLDELPMLYAAGFAIYATLANGRPASMTLKVTCAAVPNIISILYLIYPNPVFHQACYFCMQLHMYYSIYEMLQTLPSPDKELQSGRKTLSPGAQLREDAGALILSGLTFSVLAFAIWNVDNQLCDYITRWRESPNVPYWIGSLSQGHAWWHVLIAIGAHRTMTGLTGLTLGQWNPEGGQYKWALGFLPYYQVSNESQSVKPKRL